MRYLESIAKSAAAFPDAVAVSNSEGDRMTYRELWETSESLSSFLRGGGACKGAPVVVYGHKSPWMIACFLACLKSGRPYVPIDAFSVPARRVASILSQLDGPFVLEADPSLRVPDCPCVTSFDGLVSYATQGASSSESRWASDEDLAYILFTSGSTGDPKGVEVTANCFDNFMEWALTLSGVGERRVFLNQAPFSFDLSVYELATSLSSGGTLHCLTKATQESMSDLFDAFGASGANVWVSTPSFANMCLSDEGFCEKLLPGLEVFLFCGETLPNETARRLDRRFPRAVIVNSYGPTESTVAVTAVVIDREMMNSADPLPVGVPRPGTRIEIVDAEGRESSAGQPGEIVIVGDTVAKGYYRRADLTEKVFGTALVDGVWVRSYRTGDEGSLDESGMLRYRGRLDLQVKLNGFRIELGDIEGNLRKLDSVEEAVVVPSCKDGRVVHLVAHVVSAKERFESDFREGLKIKEELKCSLPHYMIPKKVVFHKALPMTGNGKVDRKALASGEC